MNSSQKWTLKYESVMIRRFFVQAGKHSMRFTKNLRRRSGFESTTQKS